MFAAVFAGCGSENGEPEANDGDKDIVGKWVNVDGEDTLVFNADGTGTTFLTDGTGTDMDTPFRYQFAEIEETNYLVIRIGASDDIYYTYSFDGDTLTLHDEAYGGDLVYKRIN